MNKDFNELKELMEQSINASSKVFIVGHNTPDLDAIGSAIGLETLCKKLGKEAYIIINEKDDKLEPGVAKIKKETEKRIKYISLEEYEQLKSAESLLIMTDVNKKYMISVNNDLDSFENIIIIDHHSGDNNTVNANYTFIDENTSSASEIVFNLLEILNIDYDSEIANYLLSGIYLDTDKLTKANASQGTFETVAKLIGKGANQTKVVEELLVNSFYINRQIHHLTDNCTTIKLLGYDDGTEAMAISTDDETYERETLAKAADDLIRSNPLDATFVMGFIEDGLVSISARGKGKVPVGKLMELFGRGGGSYTNAGAQVSTDNIEEVKNQLYEFIDNYYQNKLIENDNKKNITSQGKII